MLATTTAESIGLASVRSSVCPSRFFSKVNPFIGAYAASKKFLPMQILKRTAFSRLCWSMQAVSGHRRSWCAVRRQSDHHGDHTPCCVPPSTTTARTTASASGCCCRRPSSAAPGSPTRSDAGTARPSPTSTVALADCAPSVSHTHTHV